jgi:hypothetical protein
MLDLAKAVTFDQFREALGFDAIDTCRISFGYMRFYAELYEGHSATVAKLEAVLKQVDKEARELLKSVPEL